MALLGACTSPQDSATHHAQLGNRYLEAGDHAAAVTAYTRALELAPEQPGIWVNRANAWLLAGHPGRARADLEDALERDPRFALAYANRGILRDRAGDRQGAMGDYRRALELAPELGERPSVWQRILHNPPTATIRDRLEFLEATADPGQQAMEEGVEAPAED